MNEFRWMMEPARPTGRQKRLMAESDFISFPSVEQNGCRPRQRSRCWMLENAHVCRQTLQKCTCLQTAQQRFAVVQRTIGPNSAADSYGHRWAKIALDGRKLMRRSGFSTAILSTLDWIPQTIAKIFGNSHSQKKKAKLDSHSRTIMIACCCASTRLLPKHSMRQGPRLLRVLMVRLQTESLKNWRSQRDCEPPHKASS